MNEMKTLALKDLQEAVAGSDAAFRSTLRLMPAGGPGTKVFPPTYTGGVYAWEQRRISEDKVVTSVVLDQVPSQANRMEEALLEAHKAKAISVPMLEVDLSSEFADIGVITTLDAPHRIADAIFRDSSLEGVEFRESRVGQAFSTANMRNATILFEHCPNALIFGVWDSMGSAGGLGNKFQRVVTSEIIGFGAEGNTFHGGVRTDPLGIKAAATIYETEDGGWTNNNSDSDVKKNAKGEAIPLRPSEKGHSNIIYPRSSEERDSAGNSLRGGVTISHAMQTWVMSLPALRRLRFPKNDNHSAERDIAARTALGALALSAYAHLLQEGFDLRSRCLLIPEGGPCFEKVAGNGERTQYVIDVAVADKIHDDAVKVALEKGLDWPKEPIRLQPEPRLLELVRRSRAITGD